MKKIAIILVLILLFVSTVPLMGCQNEETPRMAVFEDYAVVMGPIHKKVKRIVIPETYKGCPVTKIANDAFRDCYYLEEVIISDSVKHILSNAFRSCHALEEIDLKNVERVDYRAFSICGKLKTIYYSEKLVGNIDPKAFLHCGEIEHVIR